MLSFFRQIKDTKTYNAQVDSLANGTYNYHQLFLRNNSPIIGGRNDSGQLGDGTIINKSKPIILPYKFIQVSTGLLYSVALDQSSYAWAWGDNGNGQLGIFTDTNPRSSPVSIVGGKQWKMIFAGTYHCLALDSNGYAWSWGRNDYGSLGDNTIDYKSSPISVVGDKQFLLISGGGNNHSVAIDTSYYAWSWGYNSTGQLGTNNRTSYSSPVSVAGDKLFMYANCGGNHVLALDLSSYAWGWGSNTTDRQLGDGSMSNRSSPTSVRGGIQWNKISAGDTHSMGVAIDGTGYGWGRNMNGQLGTGGTATPSQPTQMYATPPTWLDIEAASSFSYGIDSNSYPWAWGDNTSGELCDGTVTRRSSPVAIMYFDPAKNIFGR